MPLPIFQEWKGYYCPDYDDKYNSVEINYSSISKLKSLNEIIEEFSKAAPQGTEAIVEFKCLSQKREGNLYSYQVKGIALIPKENKK